MTKVTKGHLSFREFMKILPNTFIYKAILIKIYINANIMNTHFFSITSTVIEGHKRSLLCSF